MSRHRKAHRYALVLAAAQRSGGSVAAAAQAPRHQGWVALAASQASRAELYLASELENAVTTVATTSMPIEVSRHLPRFAVVTPDDDFLARRTSDRKSK